MTLPSKLKNEASTERPEPTSAASEPESAENPLDGAGTLSNRTTKRLVGELGRFIWPVVCLFQLGLTAGLYRSWTRGHSPSESNAAIESTAESWHDAEKAAERSRPSTPATRSVVDVGRADELLKQGRYEKALPLYESKSDGRMYQMPDSVRFKVALCLEGLGYWDRAIAEFGEIASGRADDQMSSAARLAQVRLWFRMRKIEESKRVLCELLLNSPPEPPTGNSIVKESCYLLGLALAMEALGTQPPGPRHDSALAYATLDWRPESLLIWTEPPASGSSNEPAIEATEAAPVYFQRNGLTIQDCDVAVTGLCDAASEIIRHVAESAEVGCDWTDRARELADGRTVRICTGTLPLPVLFTCLTEPLRIAWDFRDGTLHFFSYDEIGDAERADQRARTATLTLLAAARNSESKSLIAAAHMGLGNLAFAEGQPAVAASWFERLVSEFPRSPQAVQAHYNLGVVRRSTGDFVAARKSFFHVVDSSSSRVLAPLAHLVIGRIHLDEGDPEGAIPPLRRAVSIAAGTDARAAAAIDLVTALLLAENPRVAGTMLLEHRELLDQPAYRNTAAFLGTYARYRTLTDRKQAQREGQALVTSLMGLNADTDLPASQVLLIGRAYRDLGLSEQMAATFDRALQRGVPKPIAEEISYELAEFAVACGKHDDATKQFAALFESPSHAKSRRAGVRLAEIALAHQRTEDCLSLCRRLLADANQSDTATILLVMGRAFEQAGDQRQAALCFAGQLPTQ